MKRDFGKINASILIICCFTVARPLTAASFPDTIIINGAPVSRNIMHDGFLMEWSRSKARKWGNDSLWQWDVASTGQGFAGYLCSNSVYACSTWEIVFSGSIVDSSITLRLPSDLETKNSYFICDKAAYDSSGIYVVEWLIPWPLRYNTRSDALNLVISVRCLNDGALPLLSINSISPPRFAEGKRSLLFRAIIIGLLAGMYIMIQKKLRRQTLQMGSPHR